MPNLLKHRPLLLALILLVVAFDVGFFWQRVDRSSDSEFGGHPDEAAHYVTGLMVRDYIAARCPGSPMKFAENYYAHYPKIGLGVWPPVFYIVQSMWTLPFGVSRQSLMLLMCALAAVNASLVFFAIRRDLGVFVASLGALLFISLPIVREYYGMVMAETLSTIFIFGGTLAFGNFLDRGRARDVLLFGLLAALAILTKGTGLALALMAGLALLFTRKWELLARPALWAGAAITAVLAGPWTWKFKDLGKGGWEQTAPSLAWSRQAFMFYLGKFGFSLGVVLLILFGLGCFGLYRKRLAVPATSQAGTTAVDGPAPAGISGRWAAFVALIIAVIVFQSIVPAGKETRHLIPVLPAAVAIAMAGFVECFRILRWDASLTDSDSSLRKWKMRRGVFAVLIVLASIPPFFSKRSFGFGPLAEDVVRQMKLPDEVILISSDAVGEGMFIAEVARRDPKRPNFTVKRSSKELASSEWSGGGYREKYANDPDLLTFLTSGKIRFLVQDESMPENKREPHHDSLKRVVATEPKYFWELGSGMVWREGKEHPTPARLYRIEPLPLEKR